MGQLTPSWHLGCQHVVLQTPDVVLIDINMPLVDGLQATREIRALKDGKSSIPIIAMTASAMDEDRQRCAAAGMNGYISKPIEEEELLGLIAQWTDTSKQNSKAS